MSRTVLMVMLDSLRHDYVQAEDAPFLHGLASEGTRGSLALSFGFEPDGAYFAGLSPQECDGGAQFWLSPGEQSFRLTPLFGALASAIATGRAAPSAGRPCAASMPHAPTSGTTHARTTMRSR